MEDGIRFRPVSAGPGNFKTGLPRRLPEHRRADRPPDRRVDETGWYLREKPPAAGVSQTKEESRQKGP